MVPFLAVAYVAAALGRATHGGPGPVTGVPGASPGDGHTGGRLECDDSGTAAAAVALVLEIRVTVQALRVTRLSSRRETRISWSASVDS